MTLRHGVAHYAGRFIGVPTDERRLRLRKKIAARAINRNWSLDRENILARFSGSQANKILVYLTRDTPYADAA